MRESICVENKSRTIFLTIVDILVEPITATEKQKGYIEASC